MVFFAFFVQLYYGFNYVVMQGLRIITNPIIDSREGPVYMGTNMKQRGAAAGLQTTLAPDKTYTERKSEAAPESDRTRCMCLTLSDTVHVPTTNTDGSRADEVEILDENLLRFKRTQPHRLPVRLAWACQRR